MQEIIKQIYDIEVSEIKCIKCEGELTFEGVQEGTYSWTHHYKCTDCNALHAYIPSDMGQTLSVLRLVDNWINHIPCKLRTN
jgi:hypothetical protein